MWNCCVPENEQELREILKKAAEVVGSKPINTITYKFSPQGIAGLILIAELHISIYSWPEYNYTAMDIFTCGTHTNPEKALKHLQKSFNAQRIETKQIKQGQKTYPKNT